MNVPLGMIGIRRLNNGTINRLFDILKELQETCIKELIYPMNMKGKRCAFGIIQEQIDKLELKSIKKNTLKLADEALKLNNKLGSI